MELILLVIIMSSLAGSFTCSLCEAALYAVTPTQVETLRRSGTLGSRRLAILRSKMHDSIAGLATVNTIMQTIGAAWAGALVGELYGHEWLGGFSAVFALAVLLLAEIVPKGLGVAWAGTLAPRLAWTIQSMIWFVWPLAALSRWLMQALTRSAPGQKTTEQEILVMADLAAKEGEILPDELRWVENVLRLNNVSVCQLMTPRRIVFSLPADLRLDAPELKSELLIHSRIPVTEGAELDRVLGVVQRRTVYDHLLRENCNKKLRDLMRPALIVPEETGGHQLLDRLMAERQHLAVVTNASGRVVGVVSLEDIMEYLLGKPIVGEHDSHPDMQHMARERARFHADGTDSQREASGERRSD